MTDLAGEISATATPSLMFVEGEPVIVDTADFRLPHGTEAVVMRHDGTLGFDHVEYRPVADDMPTAERRGYGAWRPSTTRGVSAERPGVTIIGRVLARATRQLAA